MKELGLRMHEVDGLSRLEYHVYLEGLTHDSEAQQHSSKGRKSAFKPSRYVPYSEKEGNGPGMHDVDTDAFFMGAGAKVEGIESPEERAARERKPRVIETGTDDFFKQSGAGVS